MATVLFRAEWYPQSGVQLTWPHADTDWAGNLEEVTQCFTTIAKEILCREKLLIVCPHKDDALKHFSADERKNLILSEQKSNDTWARDHGAISVFANGIPTLLDFGFNGWGLKFAANHDNQITRNLFEQQFFRPEIAYESKINFILEGGSIESDGQGTLLTTSQCLLAPNRNQPMSQSEIEDYLKETLGANRVLWLNHGYLAGDDTDSHIDTLARFCDPRTIAYVQCDDETDEHFHELKRMEEELKSFRTADGEPYRLIPLPMAETVIFDGERLPATYANFLIINGAVLLPFYHSEKDSEAKKQLQTAFPDREIIGIDCRPLIKQHGSLHCVTMQFPEGFL